MPVGDWQFWVVTAACLIGAAFLVRPFLPLRGTKRARRDATRQRRVHLTIERKRL